MKNIIVFALVAGACTIGHAHATENGSLLNETVAEKSVMINEKAVLEISSTESGDVNISKVLADFVKKNGCRSVMVKLEAGKLYRTGELKIPQLDEVMFVSSGTAKEKCPQLVIRQITLASPLQTMSFKNICIDGNNEATFLMSWTGKAYAQSLSFTECDVKNIKQSIVRITNGENVSIKDITFNNCIISEVSTTGWGVINMGANVNLLGRIAVTNSTLVNIGDQLMDLYGVVHEVLLENCTLYNASDAKKELSRLFLLRNVNKTPASPETVTVRNVIFAGPNMGKNINSGYGDYKCLNFSDNNYMTIDLKEGNNKFAGITKLELTSDKLFANPSKGDFRIKSVSGFAGKGKAGDPRWY